MKVLGGRAIALLAVILLSGCAAKLPPDSMCPLTGFLDNTNTVTYLAPGPAPEHPAKNTKDVIANATIRKFNGDCSFKDKHKDIVEIAFNLSFVAQRGAAGATLKDKEFPYYIAVLSPDETILQRQAFTTKISFDDTGAGNNTEEHVIKIPLKSRADADKYKLIFGFVLTHDQMKYNEEQQ